MAIFFAFVGWIVYEAIEIFREEFVAHMEREDGADE